jgi:amino acid adenylation domain-containing protein
MKTELSYTVRVSHGDFTDASIFGEILRYRAHRQPGQTAYTHLVDGETEEVCVTFGDLDHRARTIAAWLQHYDAEGQRVLLLYPTGLDYIAAFFGCLYSGAIAIPAYPPRFNRLLSRLNTVVADAQASFALTSRDIFSKIEPVIGQNENLQKLQWVITDELNENDAHEWREPSFDADALAFIQYTSGSTVTPKGVMVTHRNLLHNQKLIRAAFSQDEGSVVVSWLPIYHDMGLIGGVLQPMYTGGTCVLMSPMAFLQRPFRWLQAISRYKASTSGGPNFAYDMCVRKIAPEQRALLDLSSWRVAFNGSEPVRDETLRNFATAFGPCGFSEDAFHPCYGLAEATLLVSAGRGNARLSKQLDAHALQKNLVREVGVGETSTKTIVSCGRIPESQRVVIADPSTLARCASDEVGEICVSGPSVAAGYWGRINETEETFHARIEGEEGEFLRTGDLGFVSGGELFVTGRLKDLIIIRGRNYYPSDIELTVERCHASLRSGGAAAFSVEVSGEERLVVVQELERRQSPDTEEVFETIRRAVAEEHELQTYAIALLQAANLPKTSSGKTMRRECRSAFMEGRLDALALWRATDVQDDYETPALPASSSSVADIVAWLQSLIAARLRIQHSPVDINEPIIHLGIDSMAATELVHAIESGLGVTLSMVELLHGVSIAGLAARIHDQLSSPRAATQGRFASAVDAGAEHPLSFNQQSLWFLHQLAPESPAYNIARAVRLRSALDAPALRRAFQAALDRHASLRSVFRERAGKPVQHVCESAEIYFEETNASAWDEPALNSRLVEEAHRPFDLEHGPLLRLHLFQRSAEDFVLLLVVHHIAIDFWSLAVLAHEIGVLYSAEKKGRAADLPPLARQYLDYVNWQSEMLASAEGEALWSYWRRQLAGYLPAINLPTDRPRAPVQTYKGAAYSIPLDVDLSRVLRQLAQDHGATVYMVLLASFYALLQRHTNQTDILVGSPTTHRGLASMAGVVGYFVNPLALRADLSGDPTFTELLDRTRQTVLDSFAHQDYPFALLVEQLHPVRDPSRTPLFQVMFSFQKAHSQYGKELAAFALGGSEERIELGELRLESVALEQRVAQFDLTLTVADVEEELAASFEYNTDIFDAATIERMAARWRVLLEAVVAHPETRLADLPLLPETERTLLLRGWNDTAADYAREATIVSLFEQQAARTPDAVALVAGSERLTYVELNTRANQLARRLRECGVGPEVAVGICTARTPAMVAALLGVLKAGGCYVPLDPAYPRERVVFMLEDTRAAVLLTDQRFADANDGRVEHVIYLDRLDSEPALSDESAENLPVTTASDNLAYVIYTSGSTGLPKGVAITHRSAVTLIEWARAVFTPEEFEGVLASTSICFDLSVFELFVTLCCGGKVVLADNALQLPALPAREEVTLVNTVPSAMTELLRDDCLPASVRTVNLAGEPLLSHLVEQVYEVATVARLFNLYGPSEDTTYSTYALMGRSGGENSLIGRPISNTKIYLLDAGLQPVPIGVPGEIYLGGDGLARCYLNRPELTAEKFIPDPFASAPGARLYRTQDLARYLPDGKLVFLGRTDHQVKIRGYRIELGEVETVLAQHPKVRDAVVLAREDNPGDRRLVAYAVAEINQPAMARELRAYLHERLPDFMVPTSIVLLDTLPLTPNGKVDRRALPAPDAAAATPGDFSAAPRTAVEQSVADVWAEVLGIPHVGAHDNFFELGGHSLLATQVVSRLRRVFQIEMPLSAVFEKPTLAELSEVVESALSPAAPSLPPIERTMRGDVAPLSYGQRRLWFLNQLEPGSAAYNMPCAVRLRGPLDETALAYALTEVIHRHEILRARFVSDGPEPAQIFSEAAAFELPLTDLSAHDEGERETEALRLAQEEARRPFDLQRGPLVQARLLRLSKDEHVLVLVMHHIVADGWSVGVLVKEVATLYQARVTGEGSPLGELPVQYADYAVWEREHLRSEAVERQMAYWRAQLAGVAPLELPLDKQRPPSSVHRGAQCSRVLPAELVAELKSLSRREGTTLFMTLLAGFQALLARYTRQTDVAVGTPVANRRQIEIEGLIGFFVNTLVLRTDLSDDPNFADLLQRVRATCLAAYAHQDVPFERVVEELRPERDLGRAPIFQVMLAMQEAPLESLRLPGLTLEMIDVDSGKAKFDLLLLIAEDRGGVRVTAEYSANLFEPETIRRLLAHYERLLRGVVADTSTHISAVELLDDEERRRLLMEWNDTARPVPHGLCIQDLFEQQVARTPDAAAVHFNELQLSYVELNSAANRIAHRLRSLGVGPESRVGIMLERSIEMVAGLLGVLKAGGAYVPLDPAYPAERLRFMLEDSGARLLLTQSDLSESLSADGVHRICLDAEWSSLEAEPDHDLPSSAVEDNLAYIIYTSGSTGRPKGVAITHRSAVAFSFWARDTFDAREFEAVLASTSICFDLSIFELLVTLHWGGKVVLIHNALQLTAAAQAHAVTLVNTVPSAVAEVLRLGALPQSVRTINLAGEPLPKRLVQQLYELPHVERVYNLYGPTEDTTYSTWGLVGRGEEVTIGRPLHNTRVYLLDDDGRPVPIGVPGWLHLGGAGLARGYLDRPAQTAEHFVPDPFSSAPGSRLYRTGDLARLRPNGELAFIGRADNQIKVRGFRIELGEIETTLCEHPRVREAVVVARALGTGGEQLVAYVVCRDAQEDVPAVAELRTHAQKRLPGYMVPSAFVLLDSLPVMPNGKIDRRALPDPRPLLAEAGSQFELPQTSTEEMLARIWMEVLGVERVSVNDNFFDAGGHSLMATQVIARVRATFGVTLPLQTLFASPTIRDVASAIDEASLAAVDTATLNEMFTMLDGLDDVEAQSLLRNEGFANRQGGLRGE